jgi:hypothetical protein
MITVYTTLRDKAGNEVSHCQIVSHSAVLANTAATCAAKGLLARSNDPDAYVEHLWTQSKGAAS